MYENLERELNNCPEAEYGCSLCEYKNHLHCRETLMKQAADAIEERDKYALTLQHEMMAEAEAHIEAMGRLNNQIDYLQEQVAYWQAKLVESMCGESLAESEKPRWVPVTEALPESVDDDVLVTDGEGCAVGYWRPDAQAWDSTDFGWLENRSEPPCGIHTVTHWMPLPPLPEPPKEE